ncbi:MAG: terpene cyclase/mutase family protein [Planctomycetes bacterium]|nr:terpene cyclase/mutase family protein [Planctomycetota bacterium]
MRSTLLAAVALLLCVGPLTHVAVTAEDAVFVNKEYGFQIDRPQGWTFSEPSPPETTSYAMKLAKVQDKKETSITVYVVPRNEKISNSREASDAAEANWKQNDKLSNITRGKGKLAGEEAHFLKGAYDAGMRYTIRQHFLVAEDFVYILQSLAPEKEFAAADKELTPLLESFDFVPVDKDAERLREIAGHCGSEVNFATNWPEASRRAREENKLVLVVFEVYRGLLTSRFTLTTVFMHPDVVELVNERFVPIFWAPGMNAPFEDPKVFGLGPVTFGSGLMVATPDGRIVAQAVTGHPFHVYDICREALKQHSDSKPASPNDPLERMRRGELEAAEELLASAESGLEWKVRAELLRRLRRGDDALSALDAAEKNGAQNTDLMRALLYLNLGENGKAAKLTAKSKDPEGMFYNCCARGAEKGYAEVEQDLRKLALDHPESRWGWLAASIVVEDRLHGMLGVWKWPSAEQFKAWDMPEYAPGEDATAARDDAIAFLLAAQSDDGRWINPRSANGRVFDVATSAICASSLLAHRDREGVQAACERTLEYLLAQELVADPTALFDYTIWAQIFALDYLARCNELELGNRRKNSKAMEAIIADMKKQQYPSGGWGYFHHESSPDNSIGFVTAPALLALKRADQAGAKVPSSMLVRAADALEYLQSPNGSYGYMWMSGKVDPAKEAESSLRSPLYALALRRVARLDAQGVRKSLDIYLKHREHVIAERGKSVCHTGAEGTAPYYLLFGYRFAAEALDELPAEQRSRYAEALRHDVLQFRKADGSFCDYLSVGREYGAAMALATLDQLMPQGE